jgi:PAS domain S-box-containing protein
MKSACSPKGSTGWPRAHPRAAPVGPRQAAGRAATTEAAIDSLYDPVIVTDSDGRVTRINPAAERLFGARADVIGRPIAQVARDPRLAQAVTDVLRSKRAAASEGAEVLPWAVDGARRAFRTRSTPMRDADDRLSASSRPSKTSRN